MSLFRKKPVVIEAFKWTGDASQEEDPLWACVAVANGVITFVNQGTPQCQMFINTLEGQHEASFGDFIIQGVKGEIYPCKPDIFALTYEPAE